MQKDATAPRVHSFPVRHADSEQNSIFTQEGQFSRDADGRLAAPFSCFPPFRGESPFVVTRGRMVLTDEAAREVDNLADGSTVEDVLVDAIKRKLASVSNGQLVIEPGDLKSGSPVNERSKPQP